MDSSEAKPQLDGRRRVIIEGVSPEVDAGRFPAKRTVGDMVRVEADIFTDGHDSIAAVLLFRPEKSQEWTEQPMTALVNDRWFGEFAVKELGRYRYTIHAWVDHWETWRRDLLKRIKAEQDTHLDYLIGAEHIRAAAGRASGPDTSWRVSVPGTNYFRAPRHPNPVSTGRWRIAWRACPMWRTWDSTWFTCRRFIPLGQTSARDATIR